MLSWSAKRRLLITLSVAGLLLVALVLYAAPKIFKKPTCADGKQNQGELGVDCGGVCARLCKDQYRDLLITWQRAFAVTRDSYNVVVYAENPNPRAGVKDMRYVVQLYDTKNILVAERSGRASIPPQRIVPIFEGDIKTGVREPVRVEFVLESSPEWTVARTPAPDLRIVDQHLSDTQTIPLLTASIQNDSENSPVRNMPVVVVLYDTSGNAGAASQTIVEQLPSLGSEEILFSWPAPLGFIPARIEIVSLPYPGINY